MSQPMHAPKARTWGDPGWSIVQVADAGYLAVALNCPLCDSPPQVLDEYDVTPGGRLEGLVDNQVACPECEWLSEIILEGWEGL